MGYSEKIAKNSIRISLGPQNTLHEIKEILTVNGVRFVLDDGSWGLIRASSNKPSLVVVVESTSSDKSTKKIFSFIDNLLKETGKIGNYDQKI